MNKMSDHVDGHHHHPLALPWGKNEAMNLVKQVLGTKQNLFSQQVISGSVSSLVSS